jgi:hypothetical protein
MTDHIEAQIGGWLDARKAPNGLTDEQRAALRSDIIDTVRRGAPSGPELAEWLGQVLEGVILRQKSATWPMPDVWGNVVGSLGGARRAQPVEATSPSEGAFLTFVKRMNAGEAVSEHDLFSQHVCGRALRERLVRYETVLEYTRATFRDRCYVYSPEKAMEWLKKRNPKLAAQIEAEQGATAELRDVTGAET